LEIYGCFSFQFSVEINPGCEAYLGPECSTNSTLNLVHIRSDGPHDTLHFLWSFLGAPSLLLARTPLQSNLSVDWLSIFEDAGGAISFEPVPYYLFGWSLVKVNISFTIRLIFDFLHKSVSFFFCMIVYRFGYTMILKILQD